MPKRNVQKRDRTCAKILILSYRKLSLTVQRRIYCTMYIFLYGIFRDFRISFQEFLNGFWTKYELSLVYKRSHSYNYTQVYRFEF